MTALQKSMEDGVTGAENGDPAQEHAVEDYSLKQGTVQIPGK